MKISIICAGILFALALTGCQAPRSQHQTSVSHSRAQCCDSSCDHHSIASMSYPELLANSGPF